MKRRELLQWMGTAGLALARCSHLGSTENDPRAREGAFYDTTMTRLTILHTNDLHGHLTAWQGWEGEFKGRTLGGAAQLATAIAQIRSAAPHSVLLLDAGDLIGDSMIADLTEGSALIRIFNHLGYDAMTLGNHEPDFGIAALRQRIKEAQFPFLAANLVSQSNQEPFVAPYVIKKVGDVSVGILGLTYPKTPWTTAPQNVAEVTYQDPVSALEQQLPQMRRQGVELIVVLSHLGLSEDKRLAETVQGIDVIVGGHSHNRMEQAEKIGDTLIVQAGAHGADLGRLDLTLQDGKIAMQQHALIALDHQKFRPDEPTERLLLELLTPHAKVLDEQVGTAADWLVRAQTIAGQQARKRDEESPVDSLFADIVREELSADIAFLPGVGYGVAIPPGPITAAQLRQLLPHDGALITVRLAGAEVLDVLEQALENVFSANPKLRVGGMIQVSGLRFGYDPSREKGRRVVHVELVQDAWNPDREYSVATNSMLAKGGHNQATFVHARERKEHGSQYDVIKSWIRRNSPVRAPERGRIAHEASARTIIADH
ncbi:MAG: bifunctional metallophosphatase/5'-nucleotidase [Pirellulaceae bacterium]